MKIVVETFCLFYFLFAFSIFLGDRSFLFLKSEFLLFLIAWKSLLKVSTKKQIQFAILFVLTSNWFKPDKRNITGAFNIKMLVYCSVEPLVDLKFVPPQETCKVFDTHLQVLQRR